MPQLALDLLDAHPDNANAMSPELLEKLIAHIQETGNCPPLIVRPHPEHHGRYQLLDGHHRAIALRKLEHTHAACEVWEVDDDQATMLLLTLNRLHGEDDPHQRGMLLKRLSQHMDLDALASKLPEDAQRISRLVALTTPPPQPAPPRDVDDLPHAVTFFLNAHQRRALFAKLRDVESDRSAALVKLLEL